MSSSRDPHERKTAHVLDDARKEFRYFRNAVERHWDPGDIDLEVDKERLIEEGFREPRDFDLMRQGLALFGAGEESVTEDLAPLSVVLEDVHDEMFVSTQIYEEAKHTNFFDRYWKQVINPVEKALGYEKTAPTMDRFFPEAYDELFERNEKAMECLLHDDTPENRVRAYCHYHLVIEGILAQTGYYGFHKNSTDEVPESPNLPGIVEGFSKIRSDEGRHVGFGMLKIKKHVLEDGVDIEVLNDTVNELIPLTRDIVEESSEPDQIGIGQDELMEYAATKHTERIKQVTSASNEIPDVDTLVRIDG